MSSSLRISALLAAFFLTACASSQLAERQQEMRQEILRFQEQCALLYSDPALDPIRSKVALDSPDRQTFSMLNDSHYVSTEEKPVVGLWVEKREQCWGYGSQARSMAPPQTSGVLSASKAATESAIAELYLGRITYGQLAEWRSVNLAELRNTLANIQQILEVQNQEAQFRAQQLANERAAMWNAELRTQALQQMQQEMTDP
jgi:hypothetical protein